MLIPAFYAYSREFADTKYIYVLYPIFSVIAIYTIKLLFDGNKNRNLIFCLIVIGVILSSIAFVDWKAMEQEHYRETFEILKDIANEPIKINGDFGTYGGEFTFFHWVTVQDSKEFPVLKKELPLGNVQYAKQISLLKFDTKEDIDAFDKSDQYYTQTHTLEDYFRILEKQKVSHLLLDQNNNVRLTSDELRVILRDIFSNESTYIGICWSNLTVCGL